jgi:hypothetical protein
MTRTFWLKHVYLTATAWLLGIAALALPARPDPLTLSIDTPVMSGITPGTVVTFTGTVTNNSGLDLDVASQLFLNFTGFDASALSFNQLLGIPNFVLLNRMTSPDSPLFDASLAPGTTNAGNPYLADVQLQDNLGDLSTTVGISISVPEQARIPEPGSSRLLFVAAVALIGFMKRKTCKTIINRLWLTLASAALLAGPAQGAVAPVQLYTVSAATSVWATDHSKVGIELQIGNDGTSDAEDVQVSSVTVQGGSFSGPSLPTRLGTIDPGESALLDVLINVPTVDGFTRYLLTISGTYTYGGTGIVYGFSINYAVFPNANGPGPISATSGTSTVFNPNLVSYPAARPAPPLLPNAESSILIPIGPPSILFPPTPTPTPLGTRAGSAAVQIPVNTNMTNAGVPPDSNASAEGGGVVLATYNTGISYSIDSGATFTDVNLSAAINPSRTSFFPQSDGGLCCDQVVVYLPSQNLFVWLLQYWPVTACATKCGPPPATNATYTITAANRLRLAWATPGAIRADFNNAWTYADLTGPNVAGVSSGLGTRSNEWMDYPDLAYSNNFLYVGVDHGSTTPGQVYTGKRLVARLSLADLSNPAATTVHYDYAELSGSNGLNKDHFVQKAPGRMVVGSLDNNSTFRVFTWNDGDGTISNSTVVVTQFNQGSNYTSVAPDKTDWVAVSFPGNVTGAVYRNVVLLGGAREEYIFAFDAGASAPSRPQSYVRLETLTPTGTNFNVFAEYDIWNSGFAFAMASLGADANIVTPQIGVTVAVGGGSVGFPQVSVGFKDDFIVYQVTSSNATQVSRFGDYFGTRYIAGSDAQFATEAYDVILNPVPPGGTATCAAVGCTAKMRYIKFGRPPITPPR